MVLDGIEQGPQAPAVDFLGVEGKTGFLQSVQIPVHGAGVAVELDGQIAGRFAHAGGEQSLNDLPLACELISPCHGIPFF